MAAPSASAVLLTNPSRFETIDKKNQLVFLNDGTELQQVRGHLHLRGDNQDKVDFSVMKDNGKKIDNYSGRSLSYSLRDDNDQYCGTYVREISSGFMGGFFEETKRVTASAKDVINEKELSSILYVTESESGELIAIPSEGNKKTFGEKAVGLHTDGFLFKPFVVNACVRSRQEKGAQLSFIKFFIPMEVKDAKTLEGEVKFFAEESWMTCISTPPIPFTKNEMRKVAGVLEQTVTECYYLNKGEMEKELEQQQIHKKQELESIQREKEIMQREQERLKQREQVLLASQYSTTDIPRVSSSSSSVSSSSSLHVQRTLELPPEQRYPSPTTNRRQPITSQLQPLFVNTPPESPLQPPVVNTPPESPLQPLFVNTPPESPLQPPVVNTPQEPPLQPSVVKPLESAPVPPPPPPPVVPSEDDFLLNGVIVSNAQRIRGADVMGEIGVFQQDALRPLDRSFEEINKLKLSLRREDRIKYMLIINPAHITPNLYKELDETVKDYRRQLKEDKTLTPVKIGEVEQKIIKLKEQMDNSPFTMTKIGKVQKKKALETQPQKNSTLPRRPSSALPSKSEKSQTLPRPARGDNVKGLMSKFEKKKETA